MIRNVFFVTCVFPIIVKALLPAIETNAENCGVPKNSINGSDRNLSRLDFPWIVDVMESSSNAFLCEGTLISASFVISGKRRIVFNASHKFILKIPTAGHCFINETSKQVKLPQEIFIALNTGEGGKIRISPKKIIIHEDWDRKTLTWRCLSLTTWKSYSAVTCFRFAFGEHQTKWLWVRELELWDSKRVKKATKKYSRFHSISVNNYTEWLQWPLTSGLWFMAIICQKMPEAVVAMVCTCSLVVAFIWKASSPRRKSMMEKTMTKTAITLRAPCIRTFLSSWTGSKRELTL